MLISDENWKVYLMNTKFNPLLNNKYALLKTYVYELCNLINFI